MFDSIGVVFKTFFATVLVLWLAYWFVKKMGKGFMISQRMTKHIKLVEYLPMGQEKGIALIKIQEEYYLIGISSNSITLLKELSGDNYNWDNEEEENVNTNFSDLLEKVKVRDLIKRRKKDE